MSTTSTLARPGASLPKPKSAGAFRSMSDELKFSAIILGACLVLQRFGLPFGGKSFSIVGPIGMIVAGFYLLRGTLAFNELRLWCYVALAALAVFGLVWHAVVPGRLADVPNLRSLSQFLLLTSFATFTFMQAVSEHSFFQLVNKWFAFIAIAGIVQFFLQLVGLGLFAFTGVLPDSILFESSYNLQIFVGVGDLLKSNGFFLIEPSTFSQVMALGLIIEILAFRRPIYLGLFVFAILLSFSGTGWIVVGAFVAAAAIGMGWRGIAIALGTVLLLGSILGGATLLAPDLAGAVQQRMDEFSRPGTSGHLRFITPFWILSDTLTETPSAAFIGIGPGVSERLTPPYEYDVNTPVKISLEFGIPAFLLYLLLFVGGRKSPIQRRILVPAATMFFIAGAYQQFPPVLFMILLLIAVARLRADTVPEMTGPAGG